MMARASVSTPRSGKPFEVIADIKPSGDQPQAIEALTQRINAGEENVVLLGATGT
jgi:excinuclease ABC subunit B